MMQVSGSCPACCVIHAHHSFLSLCALCSRAEMPVISEEKEESGTSAEGPQDLPRVCPYATAAKFRSDSKGKPSHTSLINAWRAHNSSLVKRVSAATAACSGVCSSWRSFVESCNVIGYHSIVYARL